MTLVKYFGPNREIMNKKIGNVFEDIFSDFFDNAIELSQSSTWPRVDIEEKEKTYQIKCEMPGVEKEDISVEIEKNVLTISGKKEETVEENNGTVHRKETFSGTFCRSFSLPESVNTDEVTADFKNGILSLSIPKNVEKQTRKITIS